MNRYFDRLPIVGGKVPGKITLSFLMLILSVVLATIFHTIDRNICIFAMLFSFIGDIALNHNADHTKQTNRDFLIGGIAFIVAHLLYCICYSKKIMIHEFTFINQGSILVVSILFVITTILLYIKSKTKDYTTLFWFGIAYLWITGINYTTIFSYGYSIKSYESLAILGGIMFLASDLIIGLEKFFGLKSKLMRELVWWLYPLGQILIIAMA